MEQFISQTETMYIGDFKNGELSGNGTYHYVNKDVYKEEW